MLKYFFTSLISVSLLNFANGSTDTLRIHQMYDPDNLNPIATYSTTGATILSYIFQQLQAVDPNTGELIPQLAKAKPEIIFIENNKMQLTYEIKEEAKWDNGTPVTGSDVEFTFKTMICPREYNSYVKNFYDMVEELVTDATNPRRIIFTCNRIHILNEAFIGESFILPEYVYDPQHLLKNFTVKQLVAGDNALLNNPQIDSFAQQFNTAMFQTESSFVSGSGSYELVNWQVGNYVLLKKKQNWWGERFADESMFFKNYPAYLQFITIPDNALALTAVKAGQLDVYRGVPVDKFAELKNDAEVNTKFHLLTGAGNAYSYIGLNTRNEILSDVRVRKAIAFLTDIEQIKSSAQRGYALPAQGPFMGCHAEIINDTIAPLAFNTAETKRMLEEAGWKKDKNHNGILDKRINGKRHDFELQIMINAGNPQRTKIAEILCAEAKKLKLNISVMQKEWTVFLEAMNRHEFDLMIGAWISSTTLPDPKQLWHTESINGGSNYTSFGNAETDMLIDNIRTEMNTEKRNAMYKLLDLKIREQVPYIFLYRMMERAIVSKQFALPDMYGCGTPLWLGELK